MSNQPQAAHNPAMNHEALFDQAVRLSYEAFEEPTDAHITGVFAVLVWNTQRGISTDAVTLH